MRRRGCIYAVLFAAMLLCGCSGGKDTQTGQTGQNSQKVEVTQISGNDGTEADLTGIIPEETVTLRVYSQLSGYYGEQKGWFAKILLDKFNIKLDFIYDGSEGFYEQQAERGDLGDIIIWGTDSDQYHSAIDNGFFTGLGEKRGTG